MNASKPGAAGRASRVLVLDDHALSRGYTVAALRQGGHAVKASADPVGALAAALEWLPQVVVLDIDLPGTDGWAWLEQLRGAWPTGQGPPRVVVLSADAGLRTGTAAPPAGHSRGLVDALLTKPAPPHALLAAVSGRPVRRTGPRDAPGRREPLPGALRRGMESELQRQLPLLDRFLADRDFAAAARLLHRLIASSRLCGQGQFEARLGDLYTLVRNDSGALATAKAVANAHYALLSSAERLRHQRESGPGRRPRSG